MIIIYLFDHWSKNLRFMEVCPAWVAPLRIQEMSMDKASAWSVYLGCSSSELSGYTTIIHIYYILCMYMYICISYI